jgi:hypothetical protein
MVAALSTLPVLPTDPVAAAYFLKALKGIDEYAKKKRRAK